MAATVSPDRLRSFLNALIALGQLGGEDVGSGDPIEWELHVA